MEALTFDRGSHPDQDISTLKGVMIAAWLAMQVKAGGLMWASPECKTWLSFLSRATFQRAWGPFSILGNGKHVVAEAANTTSVVLAWLVSLCVIRSVHIAVEQPINSMLYHVPCLSRSLMLADARRMVTRLGDFGGKSSKPLELYLNVPDSIAKSQLIATKLKRTKRSKLTSLAPTKGIWVNGNKPALAKSAAYPSKFARAIAELARLCVDLERGGLAEVSEKS